MQGIQAALLANHMTWGHKAFLLLLSDGLAALREPADPVQLLQLIAVENQGQQKQLGKRRWEKEGNQQECVPPQRSWAHTRDRVSAWGLFGVDLVVLGAKGSTQREVSNV